MYVIIVINLTVQSFNCHNPVHGILVMHLPIMYDTVRLLVNASSATQYVGGKIGEQITCSLTFLSLAIRVSLTLCMLGNLSSAKMSSAEFLKLAFSLIFFSKNTIRIANSLDPDETPRSVASHLDPNCLQRPSKFGSSTERDILWWTSM